MKQLILILIIFSFAFSSCSKSDDTQPANNNTPKKSSNEVVDSQNPFKILGEVKSAKFVIPSILEYKNPIKINIEDPSIWPELLFVEKDIGVAECGYEFDVVFTTSTGEHAVHISPIQSILGDYIEGVPRIVYRFSTKVHDRIYEFLKSITKPSEPYHPDNLTAGEMMDVYFQHLDKSRFQEGLKLMNNFLKSNDVEFEHRGHLEYRIKKYYVK